MSSEEKKRIEKLEARYAKAAPSEEIMREANRIVSRYSIVLHKVADGYIGYSYMLPAVIGHGKTRADCLESTMDSQISVVATMLERDEDPPRAQTRNMQINIRLTPQEKDSLQQLAERHGYQNLSSFVREKLLETNSSPWNRD